MLGVVTGSISREVAEELSPAFVRALVESGEGCNADLYKFSDLSFAKPGNLLLWGDWGAKEFRIVRVTKVRSDRNSGMKIVTATDGRVSWRLPHAVFLHDY